MQFSTSTGSMDPLNLGDFIRQNFSYKFTVLAPEAMIELLPLLVPQAQEGFLLLMAQWDESHVLGVLPEEQQGPMDMVQSPGCLGAHPSTKGLKSPGRNSQSKSPEAWRLKIDDRTEPSVPSNGIFRLLLKPSSVLVAFLSK
ncbi:hypothetical protein TIFTF001_037080 [Ficus carica]|uniref:Uncharacterized protein n=1 Tax=Ficus carica TaxID=3494 RepID=A0AA88E5G2_FICCA|nr:hypothetical protein TIFTF001_037080 [Ficus carica]